MRLSELQELEGKVATLDLVSGISVTSKIDKVESDGFAILDKILIFQVVTGVKNPNLPPTPDNVEHKVQNVSYGFPLVDVKPGRAIDRDHVVMAHDMTGTEMEKVYLHVTSGIQVAGADAISKLDAINKGGK